MTPSDKHIAALEAELQRHIVAGNLGVSGEAVKRAIGLLPKLPYWIEGKSKLKAEGENAVLEILPGMEIVVRAEGGFVLRKDCRKEREYDDPRKLLYGTELWDVLRSARENEPFFEVRPFGPWMEPIDEIVATKARVSIRRRGRREYMIFVNGHGFRMTNDTSEKINAGEQGDLIRASEDDGPRLNFVCSDPDHSPEVEGKVETTTDPENHVVIIRLEGENTYIHIEQMHGRSYWAGIQAGSYHFIPDENHEGSEIPELKLTRLSPWEMEKLAGEAGR